MRSLRLRWLEVRCRPAQDFLVAIQDSHYARRHNAVEHKRQRHRCRKSHLRETEAGANPDPAQSAVLGGRGERRCDPLCPPSAQMVVSRKLSSSTAACGWKWGSYAPIRRPARRCADHKYPGACRSRLGRTDVEHVGNLVDIDFGNGQFLAVGDDSTILTSNDGSSWSVRAVGHQGDSFNLFGTTFGAGRHVVVGGSQTILVSSDGIVWDERERADNSILWKVCYGDSLFVAVGNGGTVTTSPDGLTWTDRPTTTDANLVGVTYGNGLFVAVGGGANGNEPAIITSSDGANWDVELLGAGRTPSSVAFGAGRFVIVGADGFVLTSDDGNSWTERTSGTTAKFIGIEYGANEFVAAGQVGADGEIWRSPDGTLWYNDGFFQGAKWTAVAFEGDSYVIVGDTGQIRKRAAQALAPGTSMRTVVILAVLLILGVGLVTFLRLR